MSRLTRHQVIDAVVAEYGPDTSKRSKCDDGACAYKGANGAKCAFTLFVKDDRLPDLFEGNTAKDCIKRLGYSILKPEVAHIEDDHFWNSIQMLHDMDSYWNESKGLSDEGLKVVNELKLNNNEE